MRRLALIIAAMMAALPAAAQRAITPAPPVDTVIVNGQRPDPQTVIHNFIQSYSAPTSFLGKLARWQDGICPKVSGLQPQVDDFIAQRIKVVAGMVGVPVMRAAPCRSNVEIVFTPQPQEFMNAIRARLPGMLGFHGGSDSWANRLAVVSHPVQAWYATTIKDYLGHRVPEVYGASVNGLNPIFGNDGEKNVFANVLIVADTNKVAGASIGALADYAAMLALSQTQAFDSCKGLPSISNLLAQDCDVSVKATALTGTDLSYLRALYAIPLDENKGGARKDIAEQMEKSVQPAP